MADDPKPGTREAREQGCTCPVIDNHHGKGRGGDGEQFGWWMSADCPLHGGEIGRLAEKQRNDGVTGGDH